MPPITTTAECTVTEKRSKFVALAAPASTLAEAKKVVRKCSKRHRKSRHNCWACRVRDDEGRLVEQARDDGEVGRPGMKLHELLRGADLEGGVVVSRYVGGIKLGPDCVVRSFRDAGEGTIDYLKRNDARGAKTSP